MGKAKSQGKRVRKPAHKLFQLFPSVPTKSPGTKVGTAGSSPKGFSKTTRVRIEHPQKDQTQISDQVKPMTDQELGPLPGIPTEKDIQTALAGLKKADQKLAKLIHHEVAQQLGSHAAARLWFTTTGGAFAQPPIELIRMGKADVVLAYLKSQAEPGAAYA